MPLPEDYTSAYRGFLAVPNEHPYTNLYRDQLDERTKCLYDDIFTTLSMGKLNYSTIDVGKYWRDYGFDVVYTESGGFDLTSEGYKQRYDEFMDDFYAAAGAVLYDHPELFWFHSVSVTMRSLKKYANPESSSGETAYFSTISIAPSQLLYPYVNDRVNDFNHAVDMAFATISSSASDLDKDGVVSDYEYILGAFKYVCNKATYGATSYRTLLKQKEKYDSTNEPADYPTKYHVVSAAGIFLDEYQGDVVCEGYAKAFKILCEKRGIKNACIGGIAGGEGHMWNAVNYKDEWYIADATWDDTATPLTYFMVSTNHSGDREANGRLVGSNKIPFSYPKIANHNLNDVSYATIYPITLPYTGKKQIPSLRVIGLNGLVLTKGIDYSMICDGGTDTGEYAFSIKGIYPYSGTKYGKFTISRIHIDQSNVPVDEQIYNNKNAYEPDVTLTFNGMTLEKGKDFEVRYSSEYAEGYSSLELAGKGNYKGTRTVRFKINALDVSNTAQVKTIPDQTYTGFEIKPAITVMNDGVEIPKENYTYSYLNNINAGTARIHFNFHGDYCGEMDYEFKIVPAKMSTVRLMVLSNPVYNRQEQGPELKLMHGQYELVEGVDYTLFGVSHKDAGRYTGSLTGQGNFTGYRTFMYNIYQISQDAISVSPVSDVYYNGEAHTPFVVVTADGQVLQGSEYTVKYGKNTEVGIGSVTVIFPGTGNIAKGTKTVEFDILPIPAKKLDILMDDSFTYTGSAITPVVKVKNGENTLIYKKDYEVTYRNNINAGTGYADLKFKGNYSGTVTKPFTIIGLPKVDILKVSIKGLKNKKLTLKKGSKFKIQVTANNKIKYTTSNKKIVKVSSNGWMAAKKKGTCYVAIRAGSKTVKFKVTVK